VSFHRFLAFDLGAESGRGVVGTLQDGKLSSEEIHRFPNEPVEICDTLYWNILSLHSNILKGMRKYVSRFGASVDGVGIDTWGVDFGLLDCDNKLLQNPVHYRDRRIEGMAEELGRRIPPEELFRQTGMPISPVNTSLQLLALRTKQPALLEFAAHMLMMPDLFNYFLTGQITGERTNASSTQLYDLRTRRWSEDVIRRLDLPIRIMPELAEPGTVVGELRESVRRAVGLRRGVVLAPCTHDTASAVAAVPGVGEEWAFLGCGTWSVVGALTHEPVTSRAAYSAGLCNELTLNGLFLCRNIMGFWLLQQSRLAWQRKGETYSAEDVVKLAQQAPESDTLINPDEAGFYAPEDMNGAIRGYCARTSQVSPDGLGETARCILASLAVSYKHRLDQISEVLDRKFRVLHAFGGGTRNPLLCQFTANATGLPVLAGPAEATVTGNLLVQALAIGAIASADYVRNVVRASAKLVQYEPEDTQRWQDYYGRYLRLLAAERPGSGTSKKIGTRI
jgi:rhamnulokinase